MLPSEFAFFGKITHLDRSLGQNFCNKERVDRYHKDIWGNHSIFIDELKINVCRAFPDKLIKKLITILWRMANAHKFMHILQQKIHLSIINEDYVA